MPLLVEVGGSQGPDLEASLHPGNGVGLNLVISLDSSLLAVPPFSGGPTHDPFFTLPGLTESSYTFRLAAWNYS